MIKTQRRTKTSKLSSIGSIVKAFISSLFIIFVFLQLNVSAHKWNIAETKRHDFFTQNYYSLTSPLQPLIGLDGTLYTFFVSYDRENGKTYNLCAIDPNDFDNSSCSWTIDLQKKFPLSVSIGNDGNLYIITLDTSSLLSEDGNDTTVTIGMEAINPTTQIVTWNKTLNYQNIFLFIEKFIDIYNDLYVDNIDHDCLFMDCEYSMTSPVFNAVIDPSGTIYIGSNSGSVYAIDSKNGDERVIFTANDNFTVAKAIDSNGKLYAMSYNFNCYNYYDYASYKGYPISCYIDNSSIYAINPDNGSAIWKMSFGKYYIVADMAVGNGIIYILELSNDFNSYTVESTRDTLEENSTYKLIAVNSSDGSAVYEADFNSVESPIIVGNNGEAYIVGARAEEGEETTSGIYKMDPANNSTSLFFSLASQNCKGSISSISLDSGGNLVITGNFYCLDMGSELNLIVISDNGSIIFKDAIGLNNSANYNYDSADVIELPEIYMPSISEDGHVYFMGAIPEYEDNPIFMWSLKTDLTGTPDSTWPRPGHDNRNTNCAMKSSKDPTSKNSEMPVYFSTDKGTITKASITSFEDNQFITSPPSTLSPTKIINLNINNIAKGETILVKIYNLEVPDNASFYKYVNGTWINLEDQATCNFKYSRNDDGTYNISFKITDNGVLDADKKDGEIEDPVVVGSTTTSSESSSSGGGCTASNTSSTGLVLILIVGLGFAFFRKRFSKKTFA